MSLLDLITAHCFWSPRCTFTVAGLDADEVHARMEEHYASEHAADLDRIAGRVR